MAARLAAVMLFALPIAAAAETLAAEVVAVADGDTITVLAERAQLVVRLAEIDAPERGQPWGRRAKEALSRKIFGEVVVVRVSFADRYGRSVGHVRLGERDINREMVREGHAWVSRCWMRDETLLEDEAQARAARAGLWNLPEADRSPPWEWRAGGVRRGSSPPAPIPAAGFACGAKRSCREMASCDEARFHLERCGLARLDGDSDGVPCEAICAGSRGTPLPPPSR